MLTFLLHASLFVTVMSLGSGVVLLWTQNA